MCVLYKEIDSIAIEHYLTKIYTQRRKERINFCVQKSRQAQLARGHVNHVPTNYVRLVP